LRGHCSDTARRVNRRQRRRYSFIKVTSNGPQRAASAEDDFTRVVHGLARALTVNPARFPPSTGTAASSRNMRTTHPTCRGGIIDSSTQLVLLFLREGHRRCCAIMRTAEETDFCHQDMSKSGITPKWQTKVELGIARRAAYWLISGCLMDEVIQPDHIDTSRVATRCCFGQSARSLPVSTHRTPWP